MKNNISLLIEKLFPAQQPPYRVKLNPIDSHTGHCINNQNKKIFTCLCNSNYQIMINKSFNSKIQQSIEKRIQKNNKTEIRKEEYFIAFIILLKFNSTTAPLFLGYLFREFDICLKNFQLEPFDSTDINLDIETQAECEKVEGKIENIGELIEKEDKLYEIIMKQVSTNSCDLRALAERYFDKDELFVWYSCGLGICGLIFLFYLGQPA